MCEDAKDSDETLHDLLSVAGDLPEGSGREDVLARLRAASSSSLFVLSKKAQSSDVRCEAAKALEARLREGNVPMTSQDSRGANLSDGSSALPPDVAKSRHFYKFCENERWVLTTRSGVRIATFPSEAELDRWWQRLKRQRGRILTKVARGTPPESESP